jgi:hypothetical protein
MKMYRDDDPSIYTDAFKFKELHEKFISQNKKHTVALIMENIWENHALFYYLATAPMLSIELHGWKHKDYSVLSYEECYNDLKTSIDYWDTNAKRMLGISELPDDKRITTFFAPWNRSGENIIKACEDLGLKFCNVKTGSWDGYDISSFHWWNIIDNSFDINSL